MIAVKSLSPECYSTRQVWSIVSCVGPAKAVDGEAYIAAQAYCLDAPDTLPSGSWVSYWNNQQPWEGTVDRSRLS